MLLSYDDSGRVVAKPRSLVVGCCSRIDDDWLVHSMGISHLKDATDVIPVFDRTIKYHEIAFVEKRETLLDDLCVGISDFAVERVRHRDDFDIKSSQQCSVFVVVGPGVCRAQKVDSMR